MDAFKLGRLFKGEEYTISLPLPFTGEPDTFKLYFYTDNETTVEIPYNDIVISGNVAEIKFEETTMDPLNDGVLKYYLEYSINSATKIQHTNTMHYLKSPADYNPETTTDIYNNGYQSGYTQGLEDAGGEYADGYAAGIAEQKSKLSGITITENGEYTRADGFSSITVNIPQTGTTNPRIAQVGDIVVYDTARDSLRFIHQSNYNTTNYPTVTYEPVGICVTEQIEPLSGGSITYDNIKMLSLNWMDKNNPDNGNEQKQNIEWGDSNVVTNASSTTDGKANTELVLTFSTGQSDWKTASAITFTDGERMYPLFECAWRYHTNGTSQGDWYIGAQDEIDQLINDIKNGDAINTALTILGKSIYFRNGFIGSSTEDSQRNNSFYWYGSGWIRAQKYGDTYWCSRALCSTSILPI